MMRALIRNILMALCMALMLCPSALATHKDKIRVLILIDRFDRLPPDGERIMFMDHVKGKFVTGTDTEFIGDFQIWRGATGLYLINEVPLEEYVEGVVRAETGRNWAFEALKAQAVAVRTYVLRRKMATEDRQYDVTSSVLHQLYKGKNGDSVVARAVRATRGETLTYNGRLIEALYHSTSGGLTELPEEVFGQELPYMKAVTTECTLSPYCLWTRRITLDEVGKAVDMKKVLEIKVISRTRTGRAKEVEIVSNPASFIIEAKDLRKKLGWKRLPSTDFTVEIHNGTTIFEARGFGHGVGMCQWSSHELALEGMPYHDILATFYPGTEITGEGQ
jgi:stage II sporulation protein D